MYRRTFVGLAALYQSDITFRSTVRLVETYATVFDRRKRYVTDLTRDRFELLDNNQPQPIEVFETSSAGLSLAIVMDTTGSMKASLPAVKNAIRVLLESLRPEDQVAVFGFADAMTKLLDYTADKKAAIYAVHRTRAEGKTALFDAISTASQDVSKRTGKKALVVFTDGNDNSSVLTSSAATTRAKKAGVPVYTVAQGEALQVKKLADLLEDLSQKSGALSFRIQKSSDVDKFFESISEDLRNTYMIAHRPPVSGGGEWRTLEVRLKGISPKDIRIRAREGYFAD